MAKKAKTQKAKAQEQSGTSYWKKMLALPIHRRVATKLQRAVDRLSEYGKQAQRFDGKALEMDPQGESAGKVSELLGAADVNIKLAIEALQRIPEDYEPPRRTGGAAARTSKFVVGALLAIKEKRRVAYADDLTPDEMSKLKVAALRKSKVVCTTPAGVKVFIPSAHLEAVQQEPAQPRS